MLKWARNRILWYKPVCPFKKSFDFRNSWAPDLTFFNFWFCCCCWLDRFELHMSKGIELFSHLIFIDTYCSVKFKTSIFPPMSNADHPCPLWRLFAKQFRLSAFWVCKGSASPCVNLDVVMSLALANEMCAKVTLWAETSGQCVIHSIFPLLLWL